MWQGDDGNAAILGPQTSRDFSLLKADGDWWSGDWKKGGGLSETLSPA